MISYVRGELLFTTDGAVVIDTGGIGVEVNVTSPVLAMLENKSGEIELYTYLNVKEDAMTLFGFTTRRDLKLFKQLITVNGIGPKSALSILSNMSSSDLIAAILSEDDKTIAKTPGVGAKSASRIVIDLKDKLSYEDMLTRDESGIKPAEYAADITTDGDKSPYADSGVSGSKTGASSLKKNAGRNQDNIKNGSGVTSDDLMNEKNEAIQALSALGYSVSEAMKAVRSIELKQGMTTEEILKASLKYL
ncbi:MAG: Holliday junction branch migration protein RuvA [Lachnospiraceae bacterium]|nr:Holliday junction branch migration protein RuvA [Lachnospiraceae bacterium]